MSRETAPKLTLGMSGEEVVALLGEPLSDTHVPPDHTTRRLIYSRVAVLAVGQSDFILFPGLDVTVRLEEDSVVSAEINDTKNHRMCVCSREACSAEWVAPCLDSLPPGR